MVNDSQPPAADRRPGLTRRLGPRFFGLALVVWGAAAGCQREPAAGPTTAAATSPSAGPETVAVSLNGTPIALEIAATDLSRQRGLMYRSSLPRDGGMVFVFREPEVQRFWMKDTSIPLDIVYLDGGGKIVSIKPMQPFELEGVSSEEPARYAIELNQGTAERLGLRVGQAIALPPRVTDPPELE